MTDVRMTVYQQGEHFCMLYDDPAEQLVTAVEYVRGGLARGERCLFICGEYSVAEFRDALIPAGIDVEQAEARGALVLNNKTDAYLPQGTFDPDDMILLLDRAVSDALDSGFTGLCAAGDMSWLLEKAPGSERLAEYEARLNDFYSSHKTIGLCLYNRTRLPADQVDHALATHKHVRLGADVRLENPFYEPDYKAMRRKAAEPEIVAETLDILDAMRVAAQG